MCGGEERVRSKDEVLAEMVLLGMRRVGFTDAEIKKFCNPESLEKVLEKMRKPNHEAS